MPEERRETAVPKELRMLKPAGIWTAVVGSVMGVLIWALTGIQEPLYVFPPLSCTMGALFYAIGRWACNRFEKRTRLMNRRVLRGQGPPRQALLFYA